MKQFVRGRRLGVALEADSEQVAEELVQGYGFTQDRAEEAASTAKMFAAEEADYLARQLLPKEVWSGTAVVRRHVNRKREESWLMLSYEDAQGWRLDAVLFG